MSEGKEARGRFDDPSEHTLRENRAWRIAEGKLRDTIQALQQKVVRAQAETIAAQASELRLRTKLTEDRGFDWVNQANKSE